jgi:LemA protein
MQPIYIIVLLAVLVGMYLLGMYNRLVVLLNRIKEAWSGIEVQLKRRTDLIPNLVSTVKGYAKHEKQVFENVTKARSSLMNAKGIKETQAADNMLSGALKSLFAVAEAYPELKANTNFQDLQKELSDTEDKIAYSRQFYNSNVLAYNNSTKIFPNNLFASLFGFKEQEFFDVSEAETRPVKVDFDK